MEHLEAVKTRVAERYLLNELSEEERSAFEEHYFSCPDCAEEVRSSAILIENLREVLADPPAAFSPSNTHSWRSFRFRWVSPAFAAAAIVLLVAVVGYQSLVIIPRLHREAGTAVPQALTSVSLLPSVSRGGTLPTVNVGENEPFGLYLDIPPQTGFANFKCEVRSGSEVEFAVKIPARKTIDTVHLLVPGGKLKPGHYDLVVSGLSASNASSEGPEVIRYSFQVENQQ